MYRSSWTEWLLSISLFLVIYLTSSFAVCNNLTGGAINGALYLFVLISSFAIKFKFELVNILFMLLALMTFVFSCYINDDEFRETFLVAITFLSAFLFANACDFKSFCTKYTNVITFLCATSLPLWVVSLTVPSLLTPIAFNLGGQGGRVGYFCIHLLSWGPLTFRNYGMFWEPGAFQLFINLALLIELCTKQRPDYKKVILFVVTIVTTFSTTGFMGLVMIFFIPFLQNDRHNRKLKIAVVALFMLFAFALYFGQDLFFDRTTNSPIGKLLNFFDDYAHSGGKIKSNSAGVRYYAVVKPIEMFLQSPFWGVGKDRLANELFDYTMGMNTFTLINFFAFQGLFYGLIMTIGLLKFSKKIAGNWTFAPYIFLIIVVLTMSEEMSRNAFMVMLAAYGCFENRDTLAYNHDIEYLGVIHENK